MAEKLEGAVRLPDGALVRGRGLRRPAPEGRPDYGLYLGSARMRSRFDGDLDWPHVWLRWPDFRVPTDTADAVARINDLHRRSLDGAAVEVACGGGVGRTGTVLACLTVLGGLDPADAVDWVREHHHGRAVETPWQRRWVHRFAERVRTGG